MRPMAVEPAPRINLRWIVRLRWGAVAGQIATILLAGRFLKQPLPIAALFSVCGALALGNAAVHLWLLRGGHPTDRAAGLNLLADIAALTALLALSGGASNPFAVLYLVHITIGAVILPARWSVLLAVASVAAYSTLQSLPATPLGRFSRRGCLHLHLLAAHEPVAAPPRAGAGARAIRRRGGGAPRRAGHGGGRDRARAEHPSGHHRHPRRRAGRPARRGAPRRSGGDPPAGEALQGDHRQHARPARRRGRGGGEGIRDRSGALRVAG